MQGHFALDIFMLLSGFLFSAGYDRLSGRGGRALGLVHSVTQRFKRLGPLYYLVLSAHLWTPAPRKYVSQLFCSSLPPSPPAFDALQVFLDAETKRVESTLASLFSDSFT
jgi:hypothetical protein